MSVQRISVVGVPVDVVPPEDMEAAVLELLERPGTKQIVFLSVWDLLRARRKGEFRDCINNADLIIPVSKSIVRGASFLKKAVPVRYNPFDAVIQIMSALDSRFKSLYLLGSRSQTLGSAARNVVATFPGLRLVGKYAGYYQKSVESDVIQAIFKASPSLVLVSDGIKDTVCWAYRRRNQFSSSIFIYYKDAMGIFSKRIKRIDEKTFARGHEIYHEIIRNPLKLFLIFPYLWYILILILYRILKK